jgi:hypothetical protein
MKRTHLTSLLLLTVLWIVGCSGSGSGPDGPPVPKTTRVGGTIMINGKPAPIGVVELKLYGRGKATKPGDTVPKCLVGTEGKYVFSSYRDGDGAEPGDYVLSVELLKMGFGELFGPDQLLNNFNSPDNADPRFQVKVGDGDAVEIPAIDIETSKLKKQPSHPFASRPGKR